MSTRYTLSDTDQVAAVDGGDLTLVLAPAADSLVVEIGDNEWVNGSNNRRWQVERALEQIMDAFREAGFPEGPLATTFATMPAIPGVKGDITVGNAASAPAITEDGIRVSYNLPLAGAGPTSGGTSITGMGSNGGATGPRVNRLMRKFIDRIREDLVVPAVSPP